MIVQASARKGAVTVWRTMLSAKLSQRLSSTAFEDREHDPDPDEDQDRQDDHAEHRPAVPAHELLAPRERCRDAAVLEHDRGDDQEPDRQEEETRDDEEDEAEGDRDSCEEAGQRERREVRRHPVERLADREVGAAVTHVVHGEDECALQPEDSGDADEEPDHGAQPSERAEQEDQQRDEDVDDEGDGDEMAPVRLVHVPRLADDCARLHAWRVA